MGLLTLIAEPNRNKELPSGQFRISLWQNHPGKLSTK
jgi:hypothetical protein